MSYISQQTTTMPGLYDIGPKSIPPEHLVYMSNQIPSGIPMHPSQYLPQSLTQQLPLRQGQQVIILLIHWQLISAVVHIVN